MTANKTIDGVPRELRDLLERVATEANHMLGFTYAANYDECRSAVDELRALLDKEVGGDSRVPPSLAVGHIEQRRSMGLAIGAPITNVIWDLPHPELQYLPNCAKVYLHPAAQPQGEPVALTAVGVLRDDGDGGLEPEWILEGGTAELWAGAVLLIADEDPELCAEDGHCELYRAPAEQPAPVAVVMPERAVKDGALFNSQLKVNGWNACLDEVTRLNTKE